jgi:hypothetical protein
MQGFRHRKELHTLSPFNVVLPLFTEHQLKRNFLGERLYNLPSKPSLWLIREADHFWTHDVFCFPVAVTPFLWQSPEMPGCFYRYSGE